MAARTRPLPRLIGRGSKAGMMVKEWRALCHAPDNNDPKLMPGTAPARNPPVMERFLTNTYSMYDDPKWKHNPNNMTVPGAEAR